MPPWGKCQLVQPTSSFGPRCHPIARERKGVLFEPQCASTGWFSEPECASTGCFSVRAHNRAHVSPFQGFAIGGGRVPRATLRLPWAISLCPPWGKCQLVQTTISFGPRCHPIARERKGVLSEPQCASTGWFAVRAHNRAHVSPFQGFANRWGRAPRATLRLPWAISLCPPRGKCQLVKTTSSFGPRCHPIALERKGVLFEPECASTGWFGVPGSIHQHA